MMQWMSRRVFKTAYMLFLLINIIPIVNHFAYTDLVLLLFVVWGVGLLAADLIRHRFDNFRRRAFVPLLIFYALCGLSLLLTPNSVILNSLLRLGVFFLCGAVLYVTADEDAVTLRREALMVVTVYVAVTALMAAVSVGMYLLQFQYRFKGPLGENIRMGVWENRLFGVFSSGNVGGSLMAIGLLLSLGLLGYYYKNGSLSGARAVLPVVAALLQVWHIALTLSRGTTVSLLAAAVVFFALFTFGDSHSLKELGKRVVCFAVAVAVFAGLTFGLRRVSLMTVELLSDKGLVESDVTGFDRIEYDEDGKQDSDISNKRFGIWKASLRLLGDKWLYGTGRNYYYYQKIGHKESRISAEDRTYLEWSKGNTHNGYLQILVDSGALALAAYLTFLVWCLIKTIRAYACGGRWQRRVLSLGLAVLVYVLVNNLFETNMVLMSTNPIQAIFWFVAGVHVSVCNLIERRKEEFA